MQLKCCGCVTFCCKVNDSFNVVYSGGRDRRVWATDLRTASNHMLLCEERAPILKVLTVGSF